MNFSIDLQYLKYNFQTQKLENSFAKNEIEALLCEAFDLIDYNSIFNLSFRNKNTLQFPQTVENKTFKINLLMFDNDDFCKSHIDLPDDTIAEFKLFSDFYKIVDIENQINVFVNTSHDFLNRYFSLMRNQTIFPEIDMHDVAFALKIIDNVSLEIIRATEFIENSNGNNLLELLEKQIFIPDVMYGLNCYDNIDNVFDQLMVEGMYPEEAHPHLIELSETRIEDKNSILFSHSTKEIFRSLKSINTLIKSIKI